MSKIQYYSFRVKGSAGYWRHKHSEVYTWINHHVAIGNGPPSLFMTFSCAEYYWPEIKTLLKQRYEVADLPVPDFVEENIMQHINDMTLVVQEYFQHLSLHDFFFEEKTMPQRNCIPHFVGAKFTTCILTNRAIAPCFLFIIHGLGNSHMKKKTVLINFLNCFNMIGYPCK